MVHEHQTMLHVTLVIKIIAWVLNSMPCHVIGFMYRRIPRNSNFFLGLLDADVESGIDNEYHMIMIY